MKSLELFNKRVSTFYEEHPMISFEAVNICVVELLENVLANKENVLTTTMNAQLLSTLSDNSSRISELKSTVNSLQESISSMNSTMVSNMIVKFTDIKKSILKM